MDVLDLAKGVVTEVLSGKMPEMDVLATLMSRILGLAIVFMSCIIKLPQVRENEEARKREYRRNMLVRTTRYDNDSSNS